MSGLIRASGSEARSAAAAVDAEGVVAFAQEMLRVPSFSGEEGPLGGFVAQRLTDFGFRVDTQEVSPGRLNVVGRLPATGPGRSLIFNGHLDHNMVATGWRHDPFGAAVEDGWLIGLGAVNMKAANAAMTMAALAVEAAGIPHGEITVQHVVGELQGGVGTLALLRWGERADGFIVGEPSELSITRKGVGVMQVIVRTRGEMMHYSTARRGRAKRHAIEDLLAILQALGESYTPIRPGGWLTFTPDPDLPDAPIMNLGVVKGGMTDQYLDWRPSLVPDAAMAILDIRVVPEQTRETVVADLERLFARVRASRSELDASLELLDLWMPPLDVPADAEIVRIVEEAHREVTGTTAPFEFKVGAGDAAHLAAAGIPGVMYGPGGTYLSVPDERVAVAQLVQASRVYAAAAATFTGNPLVGDSGRPRGAAR